MQPLTKIKAVLFPPFIKLVDTLDGVFHRTSILIDYPGETISFDLLVKHDYKLYHAARINVTWTDTKKALLDICPPDGTTIDVFQWKNGIKTIDMHGTTSLLSVQLTPEKPLAIGLDKKVLKKDQDATK
jgi:hypothetical protein